MVGGAPAARVQVNRLAAMEAFVRVVETGSFSAAAHGFLDDAIEPIEILENGRVALNGRDVLPDQRLGLSSSACRLPVMKT